MASIKKRGHVWQVRVSYQDKQGINRTKSKSGFKTKREAEIYAADLQQQSFNGEITLNENTPFVQYFKEWYELFKEPSISRRTKLTYEASTNVIKDNFNNIPIGEIDRTYYQRFIRKFGKTHSKASVNKINSHIRACVKNAIYDNVIRKDFTENITIIYDPERTRQIDYLNIKEMNLLVEYLKKDLNYHYSSKYMIILAVYTGMRLGEVQALTWKDINFNFKTISISKAWDEDLREFKDTKNEGSNRRIRINDAIINIFSKLKMQKNVQFENDQVFLNQFDTIPTSGAVNDVLRSALKALELKKQGFHFHSLRHTHVAYLLANHVELYLISKRLGHTDMTTTIRKYSYLIDEYKLQGDNEIESVLDKIGSKPKSAKTKKKAKK